MKLEELNICSDDFDLFVALSPKQKIEFLFDATKIGIEASSHKQIDRLAAKFYVKPDPIISTDEFTAGRYRLTVTATKNTIHLNSNSLKAIRKFVSKLWNDGFLLQSLNIKKSDFDIYRYYKAYKIIGRGYPFCPN